MRMTLVALWAAMLAACSPSTTAATNGPNGTPCSAPFPNAVSNTLALPSGTCAVDWKCPVQVNEDCRWDTYLCACVDASWHCQVESVADGGCADAGTDSTSE
jgi:hypothetical protein